ncbi:MAG TPA: PAS domain-containing protein, partial [Casimicrobiaceae bacterium]|nr:PAS domain-containing protein [Casimicrobiaceae bacterium]
MLTDVTDSLDAKARLAESDSRLRSALQAAGMLAWEYDIPSGHFTVSENAASILGLADGESLDSLSSVLAICHPADLDRLKGAVAATMASGERLETECRLVRPIDGAVRWMQVRADVLRDENATPMRLVGMLLDINTRRRAQDDVIESETRFRSMADSAPVMIWISNPAGAITYANAQWMTYVGADPDATIEMDDKLHPDDRPRFAAMLAQLRNQRGPVTLELRLCRADARYRWVLCTATPRLSETGSFLGGIGSLLDIEERKMLENDLRLLAADLSAADRRKDEFLATLAHELRNPLAPIRNGLEILRLALPPNDTIARTRGMMERQLEQIVRLVDDLLDISRISSGKLSLQRARIDLREALALAIEATAAKRGARSQRLIWEPPSSPIIVDGDLVRLGQVFTNLLDNATKYSPPHGLVWLSLHADETSVEVRVRDRGEGIPSAMLGEVFEMFAQVDRSLERTQGGLGIGLTLVKRLVEMHGGTVVAHSDGPQHGSEFSVRLPLVTDASRVLLDGATPARVTDEAAHTILIADDNVDGATTLAMLLTVRGHHVEVAHDGLSAVAMAATLQPTLVLLDIGMPGLNGYEV